MPGTLPLQLSRQRSVKLISAVDLEFAAAVLTSRQSFESVFAFPTCFWHTSNLRLVLTVLRRAAIEACKRARIESFAFSVVGRDARIALAPHVPSATPSNFSNGKGQQRFALQQVKVRKGRPRSSLRRFGRLSTVFRVSEDSKDLQFGPHVQVRFRVYKVGTFRSTASECVASTYASANRGQDHFVFLLYPHSLSSVYTQTQMPPLIFT